MTNGPTDGPIDQLVKARWLAIGLSQTDLAEVLDATFQQTAGDSNGSNWVDTDRLMQIAEALEIPADFFSGQTV
jgi:transcriptional regulator with XRE-family HTH domain